VAHIRQVLAAGITLDAVVADSAYGDVGSLTRGPSRDNAAAVSPDTPAPMIVTVLVLFVGLTSRLDDGSTTCSNGKHRNTVHRGASDSSVSSS
jgi:hypothetical protein